MFSVTGKRRSLSLFYFFAGLLCGLLVGVSIDRKLSGIVAKVVSAGVIILVAFFWRRFESYTHDRYLESWASRRTRGEWFFVITEYVLIRGAVLAVAIAGPILPTIKFTPPAVSILITCVAVMILLLIYFGHESWMSCEKEYLVRALRHAAARSRIESN